MQKAASELIRSVRQELSDPVPSEVHGFVRQLVKAGAPLAVIFYGSGLRGGVQDDTLLDFYVILKRQKDWPRSFMAQLGNALLPPNVEYREISVDGRVMRAKIAFLTLKQLKRHTGFSTLDTTVWARFSQPVRLIWTKDALSSECINTCIARAIVTASRWAAFMGPPQGGTVLEFWNALYQKTYQTELRVEKTNRSGSIIAAYPERYTAVLELCWKVAGISFSKENNRLCPDFSEGERSLMQKKWCVRTSLGKPLNIARLIKAAFTFSGGARYVAWKVERHSGISLPLTPFIEKHPLVCGVPLLIRLWRKGAFQRNKTSQS